MTLPVVKPPDEFDPTLDQWFGPFVRDDDPEEQE
jgi:hypothetical protein